MTIALAFFNLRLTIESAMIYHVSGLTYSALLPESIKESTTLRNTHTRSFLLLVLMLTVGLLIVSSAHAAIGFVQVNAGTVSSASTESLAFSSNTSAGDIVLVGFDFASGPSFSSIADTQGNTFTEVGSQLTTPGGSYSRVYYAKNIKGGADSVTITLSGGATFIKEQIIEYSGVSTTTPIDVQSGNTGSAGSAYSGGTTTVADDWIFGFLASDGTGSAASGFNSRSAANGNVMIDDAAGAPGSYSTEGSSTAGWSMQMAALEPAGAPVITSSLSASGTAGSAFSYQITATNSPTSYNATGLPSGLSVNTSTGVISGTPTEAGTSSVTMSATNSAGTGSATLTLTVSSASAGIAFVQANAGTVSSASSESLAFSSNTNASDIILVGFDFASGPSVSSVTDTQGNTFTEVGSQLTTPGGSDSRVYYAKNIKGGADTVKVTLSGSASVIKEQVIEYSGVSTTTPIDVQSGNTGSAGSAYSGGTTTVADDWIFGFLASDGTGSAASGFNSRSAANGNVMIDDAAGAPGSYSTEGSSTAGWSMQMAALEPASGGGTGSAPAITSSLSASGTVSSSFSYQITASNSPTSYNATGLPSGLSVSTSTGVISGTPTEAGTSSVTISATNSYGTGSATLTLTVNAEAPVITSSLSASGIQSSAFSYQITASNSPTSYNATGLPAGLSVSTSSGLISGTPTAAGTSSVTISATNSTGTGSATLTLTVSAAVSAQCTTSSSSGTCGGYSYAGVSDPSVNLINIQNSLFGSNGYTQTMYAVNPGSWYVTANFANGNTSIQSYPDSDAVFTSSAPELSSYSSIISTFSHNMNLNSGTDAEAAYDIWIDPVDSQTGNRYEVMIWTQMSNRGEPAGCSETQLAQTTFGGSNGVPQYTWDLYSCTQGEYVWELDPAQFNSSFSGVYGLSNGSVDILSMLKYLQTSHGSMTWTDPSNGYLSQLEYGFEIASTGGVNENFQVNGFTVESTPGGSPCTVADSNPGGTCGPYSYSENSSTGVDLFNVQMGFWNSADAPSGSSQTMTAYDLGNWNTVDSFPTGNTSVETYPNSDVLFNSGVTIDSLVPMTGSFWHDMNLNSNTDAEAGWDIWLNGQAQEVMIWTQMSNRGEPGGCTSGSPLAQTTFGGSNGVVPYVWDLYQCGSERIWELDPVQFNSSFSGVYGLSIGSVDIGAMLQYLENIGNVPAGSTLEQVEYGFEVCSTGGVNEEFELNGFSLDTNE
jgi:hypothetical protein